MSPSRMRIMTPMGTPVLDALGDGFFVPLPAHSVGMPLRPGQEDVPWPCNPKQKYIVHFPEERAIWSYGQRLRRQRPAGQEMLCAAHRLVHGARRGLACRAHAHSGRRVARKAKDYVAAAFPVACGKTNFAMLIPPDAFQGLEGHHGGRRHRLDQDRLRTAACCDQPRSRLFRRGARHQRATNPNAMETITRNRFSPTSR